MKANEAVVRGRALLRIFSVCQFCQFLPMVAVVIVGAVAYHHDDVPYVEDVEGGDAMMLLPHAGDVDGRRDHRHDQYSKY